MHAHTDATSDKRIPPLTAPSSQSKLNNSPRSGLSIIKNWTKGELIGRGGFGKVFLAIEKDSGALFAV